MKSVALALLLILGACSSEAGMQREGASTGWRNGTTTSADGSVFSLLCYNGEWHVNVKTIERLVPPESESQWVNRDVYFQFDKAPEERTKGTLNENTLGLTQADEGSTVDLNYGQDIAAGLMRGDHKALVIRTRDGNDRPKEWRFDITGSREALPVDDMMPCPRPPASVEAE